MYNNSNREQSVCNNCERSNTTCQVGTRTSILLLYPFQSVDQLDQTRAPALSRSNRTSKSIVSITIFRCYQNESTTAATTRRITRKQGYKPHRISIMSQASRNRTGIPGSSNRRRAAVQPMTCNKCRKPLSTTIFVVTCNCVFCEGKQSHREFLIWYYCS